MLLHMYSESGIRSESVVTSKIFKYIKNCFHCFRITPTFALISGETKSKPAKKKTKISSLCKRPLESAVSKRGQIPAQNQIKSRGAPYMGMLLVEWIMG